MNEKENLVKFQNPEWVILSFFHTQTFFCRNQWLIVKPEYLQKRLFQILTI